MLSYDYIIAGGGLAGTVLALTLRDQGKKVMVLDDPSLSSASRVAAGLYNPLIFRKLGKTWNADKLLPFAEAFYCRAEAQLSASFFHPMPLARIFSSIQEQNDWALLATDPDFAPFMEAEAQLSENDRQRVQASFGHGIARQTGYLDIPAFLEVARTLLEIREEKVDHRLFQANDTAVVYRDIQASAVIFAEGYRVKENPYFNWLPVQPLKGEILTIEASGVPEHTILNKSGFLLPMGGQRFRAGATFDWSSQDEMPSEKGKTELCQKLDKMIGPAYTLHGQQAGIRPTVRDRRPLIGVHPQVKRFYAFNGMGTRGVILAPYYAAQLYRMLEQGIAPDPEVDLVRFLSLYRPTTELSAD